MKIMTLLTHKQENEKVTKQTKKKTFELEPNKKIKRI